MRRSRHAAPEENEIGVLREDESCTLRLPLQSADELVRAWLHVDYRVGDPLAIDVSVRSPSGAVALERTLLRRDLRTALDEPVLLPGITVGPAASPGMVAIVFHEQTIVVPVTLPSPTFADFLRACDSLVPMNERAEADAVTRALQADFHTG